MPTGMIRRAIWGLGAIVFTIALGSLVISFIAGRQLVQSSLVQELSALTGKPVSIDGSIKIHVFPSLVAELKAVSIRDWASNDFEPALLEVETILLALSPRDAIGGRVNIQSITLKNPRLNLPDGDDLVSWARGGRIDSAFRRAQQSLSDNPDELAFLASRGKSFGRLIVEGGSIRNVSSEQILLTSIDGDLTWNPSTDAAAISGSGIWNGETISLTARIADIIHLAAGRTSKVELAIQSKPVNTSFNGTATLKPSLYLDGLAGLEFTSGKQLENWIGSDFPLGDLGGPFKTTGTVKGDLDRWTFTDADFTLEKTEGRGNLTLVTEKERRKLSGTFDLSAFDLVDFAQIIMPLEFETPPIGVQPAITLTGINEGSALDIDLRVSAERAFANGFVLTDIAATAQRSGILSAFDINNAEIFGGVLQFAMRVNQSVDGQPPQTELRILAEDIDGAKFADSNVAFARFPRAKTTLSAILRGDGEKFQSVFDSATGSISFRANQGTLKGLALSEFVGKLREGSFFDLNENSQANGNALAFNILDAKGVFENGAIRFENIALGLERADLNLNGLASLANQNLAMTGELTLAPNNSLYKKPNTLQPDNASPPSPKTVEAQAETLKFFIGGNFSQAFVSPIAAQPFGN